jgi:two-component system, cell cycle sensor histidine kinase and response regulator CckA
MSEPISILIVDDDEGIRALAQMMLRRNGHTLVCAAGPGEALAAVREQPNIRVAVIDIVLPMMTGFDLATEIRKLAPDIKVVYISGSRSDHFRQPVDEPVVSKPFTVDALTDAIDAALAT